MKDKVDVYDFSKYNFVTPIMKPAAMKMGELLDGVMKNYRLFYVRKTLFHCPWRGSGFRRRFLLGCLKAFLKAGAGHTFFDLGKAGCCGPQAKGKVDFHFDETCTIAAAQTEDWEPAADRAARTAERREAIRAQGKDRAQNRTQDRARQGEGGCSGSDGGLKMPADARVLACGGGDQHMEDA